MRLFSVLFLTLGCSGYGLAQNYTIRTIAGTGALGYNGDNIAALAAQLNGPTGVAVDSGGNLYIADVGDNRIRKVSNGVITTVAGNGTQGYNGDNIAASAAQLNAPTGVAVDSAGNLYIADTGSNRIRKVVNGTITTVAGTGTSGYNSDNIAATTAQLNAPNGVAVDSAGNLYIADTGSSRIRKVSNGVITTVAGNGTQGYNGDNIVATSAQLYGPSFVAADSGGNLYIADVGDYRIRKVTNGTITTVAGTGTTGYNGDNIPAATAQLGGPWGVAVDPTGSVFLADFGNQRVRALVPSVASVCTYSVSTSDLGVAAAGGTSILEIHTGPSCLWTISGLPAWLTVSGLAQGIGSSTITLVAAGNPDGPRSGSLSIGGVTVPVQQCAGSGSCVMRALPHLAFGSEWTTALFAVNSSDQAASFSVSFYGDDGNPTALPFWNGLGPLSALNDTVPAGGTNYYEAANPSGPTQSGWGLISADSAITVHGLFRRAAADGKFYEAAAPASEGYSEFLIPFDATTFIPANAPYYTGLAVANLNASAPAHVTCVARDQAGTIIPDAVTIPALNPFGHWTGFNFPALSGKRGTLDCSADTLTSAIAFRSIGTSAIASLPVIVK